MRLRHSTLASIVRAALLAAGFLGPATALSPASAQGWPSFAGDPSHRAESATASQLPQAILWSTTVDLNPENFGGDLNAHYGSPVITPKNTVIVPVKVGLDDTFRAEGHSGTDGTLIWQLASDYVQPPHDWTLPFQPTLAGSVVVVPGAGGTVIVLTNPDNATGTTSRLAFFGIDNYNNNPGAYNNAIQIITPITADAKGNLYFGFLASGAPGDLQSGLACVNLNGAGTWISAAAAANDPTMQKVAYNCAPALSPDGSKVYVGINNVDGFANGAVGYLVAVASGTLAPVAAVRLKDVAQPQNDALFFDDSSAAPTVGPDGDVYYGVLENPFPSNHDRGWLLHFDGNLKTAKTAGAFGWDITASVVPAGAVPSYRGKSSYLVLTKYNDYADVGGDGVNRLAVQDPNATMTDPVTGAKVMKTIITIIGPTPDQSLRDQGHPLAVLEWCLNTTAVDTINKCAIVNSEDGNVYRWDFTTNSLTARVNLSTGIGEPYTPTVIGPDGKVYGINNATLFAMGTNLPAGAAVRGPDVDHVSNPRHHGRGAN
jgi:hypothetical protein